MINIRLFRSKRNGVRVELYRKHTFIDNKKTKITYKKIDSFLLNKGYTPAILEKLSPEEIIELKNYLAEFEFAEKFNVLPEELTKFTINMPQKVYDALVKLYIEAKSIDIDFVPQKIMLNALINQAKIVQQKVDKHIGFNSGILESIGITTTPLSTPLTETDKIESHALFKKLLALNQSIGKTCAELEKAARTYGKAKRIPPVELRKWAGDIPSRHPNQKILKWAYAIAIDVLQQHNINPMDVENPKKVARYWTLYKRDRYALEEAKQIFLKTFSVPKESEAIVLEEITRNYTKPVFVSNIHER